ncbi:Vacuolar triacylglycerol lipase [Mycena sanguinolenta]|uniref:Vacuolar triacylglycerol lipase n=1 Tax=Mycena sanguinolenta TaxID=230812 RepID=A0A8H6U158_9AGAR|nr:Vacuolar triacylglycerol lipase [Mycena sanguinolenta]
MALTQYPLDKTFIVAAWLEAILYGTVDSQFGPHSYGATGIYFCGFWFSVYINSLGGRVSSHNRIMRGSSVVMFVIATVHVGMNGYRTVVGYTDYANAPGESVAFLGQISSWHNIFKDVLYTIQSLLGDAMAIYRCYIVWQDYRFVILPVAMLVTSTVAGSMVTVLFANLAPDASIFSHTLTAWIDVFYSMAVAQNIITTSLIALRLWQVETQSKHLRIGGGVILPMLRILMESAALYLFVEILLLSMYTVGYNVQFIVLETVTPIVGITFGMITIRIILRSQRPLQDGEYDGHATVTSVPMRRIAVNITTQLEDDGSEGKMPPV